MWLNEASDAEYSCGFWCAGPELSMAIAKQAADHVGGQSILGSVSPLHATFAQPMQSGVGSNPKGACNVFGKGTDGVAPRTLPGLQRGKAAPVKAAQARPESADPDA